MFSQILTPLLVAFLVIGHVEAAGKIKLDDRLLEMIGSESYRALKIIISARRNHFKFNKVGQAQEFLELCKVVRQKFLRVDDAEYGGAAKSIKDLLATEEVTELCQNDPEELENVKDLDLLTGFQLNRQEINEYEKVLEIAEELKQNDLANRLLDECFVNTAIDVSNKLLQNAASLDKTSLSEKKETGFMFMRQRVYKYGCETALIVPICHLVCRSKQRDIALTASGRDIKNFTDDLIKDFREKIRAHVAASDVGLDDLRYICATASPKLFHMALIDKYVQETILSEEMISEKGATDKDFSFYYELHRLCHTITYVDLAVNHPENDEE